MVLTGFDVHLSTDLDPEWGDEEPIWLKDATDVGNPCPQLPERLSTIAEAARSEVESEAPVRRIALLRPYILTPVPFLEDSHVRL